MQVTQTNADGLKHEFKVVIPAGHLEEKVSTRLAEVGRTVRIPGFRPGKVPMGILRKKYGSSVMGEVLESAVNDGTQHALDEHKLRPAVQPKVEITSFKEGDDLEFTIAVETLPEVKISGLGDLALEKPVAEVTDVEVEQALQNIASRQEKTEAAEKTHAAESGEVVVIDFLGKVDGVAFDGGKAEGYSLKLGSGNFIPGFEDQLIGAKAEEERVVKVTFPADYGSDALAGKDAEFEVKVHEVRKVVPAVLDDELAKGVGLETLDELKKAVREEIERDYTNLSRAHLKRHLLDQLAAQYDFGVPEGMVELEFDAIWKQLEKDKSEGRLDAADQGKSDETLKEEYRAIATRRVRLGLVLSEVGRENNITIVQEDLNRAVMAEARRYPGQEHLVFQYFQKNPDALNSLRAPIFEEKVIDFILELAKVTEKVVSIDDLRKDPEDETASEAADAAPKPKKKAAKKKVAAEE
ncbi:trigger factor [Telmatospirillum siberiense]|uniref:Trigger factor n=1 Tax=Telmatospirillum siberiense TaxID=382514 RepID=A0A2N3PZM6_9PROT|nr:trigger factor [Telmatospirillum siberiense]PKU25853.1 trigger factor [Telmatospirillum siberiense]